MDTFTSDSGRPDTSTDFGPVQSGARDTAEFTAARSATRERSTDAFDYSAALGGLFTAVSRQYSTTMQELLRPYRVLPGQIATLLAILEQEGLTQGELSRLVGVEQPTMANTLRRMERDGLVRRLPDVNDRRITRHYPTEDAREIGLAVRDAARELNDHLSHGLSEMERLVLPAVLRKITRNLTQIEADCRREHCDGGTV